MEACESNFTKAGLHGVYLAPNARLSWVGHTVNRMQEGECVDVVEGKFANKKAGERNCKSGAMVRIHLILYTDSILSSDKETFKNAASVLKKDYTKHDPASKVVMKFVKTGKEIVGAINANSINSIVSLDVVSHGNQGGVHIARKVDPPVKSSYFKRKLHPLIRKTSDHPQNAEEAEYSEESMHGLYSGRLAKLAAAYYFNQVDGEGIGYLSAIEFDRFIDTAYVEFHGCRTGEYKEYLNEVLDNFAKNFADELPSKSTVVGHVTAAAPNKNPNGNKDDYRYGVVRVYQGGGKLAKDGIERGPLRFVNSSTP